MTKAISGLTNMNGAVAIDRAADFLEVTDTSGGASYKATPNFILGFVGGVPVSTTDTQTVQNKTLDNTNTITIKDTLLTMQDDGDATKQARFQLSGITAGQTRVYTLPDATGTLMDLASSQTATNKTFTSPTLNTPTINNPTLNTNTISEFTAAAGVTVDGLLIKDGTIPDDLITPAKLSLGKTSYKGYLAVAQTTTSASWQAVNALSTTSGSQSITTFGGDVMVNISIYTTSSAGNGEIGFRINGTDYEVATYSTSDRKSGTQLATGIPAGTYTITFRFKSSGGGTQTIGAFNDLIMSAWELSN